MVEFQKRGLPHAHIFLFLDKKDKYPTGNDIDKIILAEIPKDQIDPCYYKVVQDYMIHGARIVLNNLVSTHRACQMVVALSTFQGSLLRLHLLMKMGIQCIDVEIMVELF